MSYPFNMKKSNNMDIFDKIFAEEEQMVLQSKPKSETIVLGPTKHRVIQEETELKFSDHLDKILQIYDNLIYAYEHEKDEEIKKTQRKFQNMYQFMVRRYSEDGEKL